MSKKERNHCGHWKLENSGNLRNFFKYNIDETAQKTTTRAN